jgi:hypothetical protein
MLHQVLSRGGVIVDRIIPVDVDVGLIGQHVESGEVVTFRAAHDHDRLQGHIAPGVGVALRDEAEYVDAVEGWSIHPAHQIMVASEVGMSRNCQSPWTSRLMT